jgi:hypothetical protein
VSNVCNKSSNKFLYFLSLLSLEMLTVAQLVKSRPLSKRRINFGFRKICYWNKSRSLFSSPHFSNILFKTPLYPQKLALTSPTSGGLSVGIVRSRTKATELVLVVILAFNCSHHINDFSSVFLIKQRRLSENMRKILQSNMKLIRKSGLG